MKFYVYNSKFELLRSSVAEFPALTVCPNYDSAYKKDFLNEYGITTKEIRALNFPSTINMTVAEFYEQATHSLQDIVSNVEIKTLRKLENKNGTTFYFFYGNDDSIDNSSQNIKMAEEYWKDRVNHTHFGQCFTFIPPKWLKDLQVCSTSEVFHK